MSPKDQTRTSNRIGSEAAKLGIPDFEFLRSAIRDPQSAIEEVHPTAIHIDLSGVPLRKILIITEIFHNSAKALYWDDPFCLLPVRKWTLFQV
jgi:hypothetical protein